MAGTIGADRVRRESRPRRVLERPVLADEAVKPQQRAVERDGNGQRVVNRLYGV